MANAIHPVIEEAEPLERALNAYSEIYEQGWQSMMAQKLGLNAFEPGTDERLTTELLSILPLVETDMTLFYRNLAITDVNVCPPNNVADEVLMASLTDAYYDPGQLTGEYTARMAHWLRQYIARLREDGLDNETRRARMNAVNPKYVLRNYLAQLAIDKSEQGDHSMVNELLDVLRRPYDEQPGKEAFAQKRPDWARTRAGCSMLSCSS